MPTKKALITAFLLIHISYLVNAQGAFYGSNLMEFQLGNLPQLEPKDQFSLYDQLNLGYRYKSLSFQTRVEQYYPSFESAESYTRLSQFKIQYISKHIELQAGHHYTSLGRGVLLRTYEIPGSIWETRGYRVRYGFYKDLFGATLKLKFNNLQFKILGGKILDVTLPPTIEDRRPDLAGAIESSYRIKRQKVGLIYMANQATGAFGGTGDSKITTHYTSLYFDGSITDEIFLYSEFSHKLDKNIQPFSFSTDAGYGAYVGLNYYKGPFGLSLEYKDYQNIFIGTGLGDPPTLVKEQSYRLLNRSTHIPIITDESGYQIELYYQLKEGNLLTFNSALSKNEISEDNRPIFMEFFGEYQFHSKENLSGKIFVDYSKAPFINEENRYASGGSVELIHKKMNSTFEFEWQMINRVAFTNVHFSNWYLRYGLSKASKFAASLEMEITGDPILVEQNKKQNIFPSTSFSYHITRKNILTLFIGKRRGGPACNSGVCYDVLSFEGLEARFTSRF